MAEQSCRSAVVAGAGGGLGRDLAPQLAAKGYVVFGTAMATQETGVKLKTYLRSGLSALAFAIGATTLAVPHSALAEQAKAKAELVVVDRHDRRAVRNVNNVLTLYQMMINENQAMAGTAEYLVPGYIQHNPLIADGASSLGKYFAGVKAAHPSAHVVVHRVIASGDYVFAHVNFVNILTDDPNDPGVAGVDIYKMNADGRVLEHWDTLQLVGDPKNSAPWVAPNIPRANPNGMF